MGPQTGSGEVACASSQGGVVSSGGGFSSLVARPAYQNDAVKAYFGSSGVSPAAPGYAENGRGYPDVVNFDSLYNSR
jgi:tripeptidyl-peptidase-1